MDRRQMMIGAGLAVPALLAASGASAQTRPNAAASNRVERLARAAQEARLRLDHGAGGFSGPGWDYLVARGRESQFFLIGEEHGIAENPLLAAALFRALVPAGYARLAVEISAPMAVAIDRAVTAGGLAGLRRMFADEGSRAAFFGMRQEAEMLAAVRAALPGRQPFLWGNDYEVGGDRYLIGQLKARRKPAAAVAPLAALEAASNAAWARYHQARNIQQIFSFSGDPALVRAVRTAWRGADAGTLSILNTLEETLEINRLWVAGQAHASNERRSAFLRANFMRHMRAERRPPRVMLKYGASHMVRGLSAADTFDLGALVSELAYQQERKAFHLLVLPGAGSETAAFDPAAYAYRPVRDATYLDGLEAVTGAAFGDGFTLFDTHMLRAIARSVAAEFSINLIRAIHGFDAILVMTGSMASANLIEG